MSWATRAKNSLFGRDEKDNLLVKNAVIIWTNFKGEPTKFHKQGGYRTFNLVLTEEVANELIEDGWNVKHRDPMDEQDDILYYTEIVINMAKAIEPEVWLLTEWNGKKRKMQLHGDDVGRLDDMRFAKVDLNIYPNHHDNGVKGHCNGIAVVQAKSNLFGSDYEDYEEYAGDSDISVDETPW